MALCKALISCITSGMRRGNSALTFAAIQSARTGADVAPKSLLSELPSRNMVRSLVSNPSITTQSLICGKHSSPVVCRGVRTTIMPTQTRNYGSPGDKKNMVYGCFYCILRKEEKGNDENKHERIMRKEDKGNENKHERIMHKEDKGDENKIEFDEFISEARLKQHYIQVHREMCSQSGDAIDAQYEECPRCHNYFDKDSDLLKSHQCDDLQAHGMFARQKFARLSNKIDSLSKTK